MTSTELGMVSLIGDLATAWVSARLAEAGFHIYASFDLHSARVTDSLCPCPQHGTSACDCQFVVLLVYRERQRAPATVVLHGHQGRTWITLAGVQDRKFEATIVEALAAGGLEKDELASGKNGKAHDGL